MKHVVIAGARRTPIGGFQGYFTDVSVPSLAGVAINAALRDSRVKPEDIDEVLMGIVLPAGVGQAPARQASVAAGLPRQIPCTAIGKVCGSGMKAVIQGVDQIDAGSVDIVVAGGMESMTNSPYLSMETRSGARLGHRSLIDHMFLDGLEDAYQKATKMGEFAEKCVQRYKASREEQDEYALKSLMRALDAQNGGLFKQEIAIVEIQTKEGTISIDHDEQPTTARPEKIKSLKPAFSKSGTVTAANASSISDGAAALVLASQEKVDEFGLPRRARVVGLAS